MIQPRARHWTENVGPIWEKLSQSLNKTRIKFRTKTWISQISIKFDPEMVTISDGFQEIFGRISDGFQEISKEFQVDFWNTFRRIPETSKNRLYGILQQIDILGPPPNRFWAPPKMLISRNLISGQIYHVSWKWRILMAQISKESRTFWKRANFFWHFRTHVFGPMSWPCSPGRFTNHVFVGIGGWD